jgi:hypothetical protein
MRYGFFSYVPVFSVPLQLVQNRGRALSFSFVDVLVHLVLPNMHFVFFVVVVLAVAVPKERKHFLSPLSRQAGAVLYCFASDRFRCPFFLLLRSGSATKKVGEESSQKPTFQCLLYRVIKGSAWQKKNNNSRISQTNKERLKS